MRASPLLLLFLSGLTAAGTPTLGPEAQALEDELEALFAEPLPEEAEALAREAAARAEATANFEAEGLAFILESRDFSDRTATRFHVAEAWLGLANGLSLASCVAPEPEVCEALEARLWGQVIAHAAVARGLYLETVEEADAAGVVNIWVDLSRGRIEELDDWTRQRAAQARYQERFGEALACEVALGRHMQRPEGATLLAREGEIEVFLVEGEYARCLEVYRGVVARAEMEEEGAEKNGDKWGGMGAGESVRGVERGEGEGEDDRENEDDSEDEDESEDENESESESENVPYPFDLNELAPGSLSAALDDRVTYETVAREYREANDARIRLRAAQLLFAHGHLEEAQALVEPMSRWGPEGGAAESLSMVIANMLGEFDAWNEAHPYSYLCRDSWPDFEPGPGPSRLAQLAFLRAQALREDGRLEDAARVLLHFAAVEPGSEQAGEALYFAAESFERVGEDGRARQLYRRILDEHPQGPHSHWLFFRVAADESAVLDFEAAIEHYEQLVRLYPDSQNAPAALFNAGVLNVVLGHHQRAAEAFERYATEYPDQPDAEMVHWHGVLRWREVGPDEAAAAILRHLKRYPDAPAEHRFDARRWLAEDAERRGDTRLAERRWEDLVRHAQAALEAGEQLGPEARAIAASAERRALERAVIGLEAMPSAERPQRNALAAIEVHATELIRRWPEGAEASLVLLARAEGHVAETLRSTCPEDCAEDIAQLEEARQQKLLDVLRYSREAGHRSEWTDAAGEALNAIAPGSYAPAPELGLQRHGIIFPPLPEADPPSSPGLEAYVEGVHALRAGDADQALAHFERSLQLRHRSLELWIGQVAALALAGRHEEARALARELLTDPNDPRQLILVNNMSWAYLHADELDTARLVLYKAFQEPGGQSNPLLLSSLAALEHRQGNDGDVRVLLSEAIDQDPNHLPALLWLAELNATHWGEDEARRLLERALTLEPEAADIQAALAALEP